jgi:GEVED domain/Secretion system C-terminal sorting domain
MRKNILAFVLVILAFQSGVFAQYCVAPHSVACSANDNINNFTIYGIGNILDNSGSGCTAGNGSAYTIYSSSSYSTTLQAGLVFTVIVNTTANNNISLWIDYDHNAVFDAYEWTEITASSVANSSTYANVLIPNTALSGPTGLRVRSRLAGNPNGDVDACTLFGSGETEDYTIDILSGPANDLFINAQSLTPSITCNTVLGSIENCTQDISFFTCNGFSQSVPEVWYKFVADSSVVEVQATGTGALLPMISLWENLSTFITCAQAAPGGIGQASMTASGLIPGNTYYIAVSSPSFSIDYDFYICVKNKKSTLADVTIDLDITPAVVAGIYQGGSPDIVGSFNGFNPAAADDMYSVGGNNFRKTYTTFAQGDTISFKFRINHNWSTFEATSSRTYVVNDGDTLKCVWDSSSFTVVDVTIKRPITFRVNMSNETVSPNGVFMVGNFNNYDADSTAMTPIGNGVYEAVVDLDTASFIRYRYVNGLNISGAETVPIACGLSNVGGFNERFLDVPENTDTLATICFNECVNCVGYAAITFRVDLSGYLPVSPNGVHIAGSFNGWDYGANPMTSIGGNVYEAVLNLDTSSSIRYKFVNGNQAADAEVVPAACGIIQGTGGYKRYFTVTETPTTLANACFSLCSSGNCALAIAENNPTENTIFYSNLTNEIVITSNQATAFETISIYSITGKLIFSENKTELKKGTNYVADAKSLAEGIYFVSLTGPNFKQTKKLVVNR